MFIVQSVLLKLLDKCKASESQILKQARDYNVNINVFLFHLSGNCTIFTKPLALDYLLLPSPYTSVFTSLLLLSILFLSLSFYLGSPLTVHSWVGGRLRSRRLRTRPTGRSPTPRGKMGSSRKLMNSMSCVMPRFPL